MAFDDVALYVGARLFDTQPQAIRSQLARRDRWVTADSFTVFLDPHRDRRSGVYFGVNAAGTQYDGTLMNDDWRDDSWDGVWQSEVVRDGQGWTVEMRIPFSQLRFKDSAHTWGINFERVIARHNEHNLLAYTPRRGSGFVSRFPELQALGAIRPPTRIELAPYASFRVDTPGEAGDPFRTGWGATPRVGADLKVGLGSHLTLDATVYPDFGQVEVDPAVVNLSDREVYFPERRPFFIEGASVFTGFGSGGSRNFWGFNWPGPDLVYSRRIGRTPQVSLPDNDYEQVPQTTDILGAAKLTGKLGSWNVGTVHALTQREYARFSSGGVQTRVEAEPVTYYGATRVQNEINGGRQGLGLMSTLVVRDFQGGPAAAPALGAGASGLRRVAPARRAGTPALDLVDPTLSAVTPLRDQLNGTAAVLGVDGWTFLDASKTWVISGWMGGSRVTGSPARLKDLQENSVHYFQRPDATHVGVDPAATALGGYAGRLVLNKQNGNVLLNAALGALSPGWEINDLGFGSVSDLVNAHFGAGYQWPDPGKLFRRVLVIPAAFASWDFEGNGIWQGLFVTSEAQFLNFWNGFLTAIYNPGTVNNRQTRGGPLMLNPRGVYLAGGLTTDGRKRWTVGLNGDLNRYAWNNRSWVARGFVEVRPLDRLSLNVGPSFSAEQSAAQYIDTLEDPAATATYGNRYLFGELDQKTLSADIRLNCIFTPKLSLELFAQPLVSAIHYRSIRQLAAPRSYAFLPTEIDPASESSTFVSLPGQRRPPLGVPPRLDRLPGLEPEPGHRRGRQPLRPPPLLPHPPRRPPRDRGHAESHLLVDSLTASPGPLTPPSPRGRGARANSQRGDKISGPGRPPGSSPSWPRTGETPRSPSEPLARASRSREWRSRGRRDFAARQCSRGGRRAPDRSPRAVPAAGSSRHKTGPRPTPRRRPRAWRCRQPLAGPPGGSWRGHPDDPRPVETHPGRPLDAAPCARPAP